MGIIKEGVLPEAGSIIRTLTVWQDVYMWLLRPGTVLWCSLDATTKTYNVA